MYFDMDGTIADLYGVDNWLDKLIAEDPSPYYEAEPLVDPSLLWDFCASAAAAGYRIGIVTWLSKECRQEYAQKIIESKLAWCDELLPEIDEIVLAPYGTPKSTIVQIQDNAILIDDEAPNRTEWNSLYHNRVAYSTEDIPAVLADISNEFTGDYDYADYDSCR